MPCQIRGVWTQPSSPRRSVWGHEPVLPSCSALWLCSLHSWACHWLPPSFSVAFPQFPHRTGLGRRSEWRCSVDSSAAHVVTGNMLAGFWDLTLPSLGCCQLTNLRASAPVSQGLFHTGVCDLPAFDVSLEIPQLLRVPPSILPTIPCSVLSWVQKKAHHLLWLLECNWPP